MSPEYSNGQTNDIEFLYSVLLNDVQSYSRLGDIIIQGDFNAYTNTKPDFIEFDSDSERVNIDDLRHNVDIFTPRNNLDHKHLNNSGKCLLNFCKETRMRIMNGRTIGDV